MKDDVSTAARRILVTGATGYVGGQLVPRLLERGYQVRCLVREAARVEGRGWKQVEVAIGDVLDYQTLVPALEGVDTAYYLVHAMVAGEAGFEARDLYAAQNFGRAAQAAGVRRIIYLGGLGRDEDELSPHLRSRHEVGEQLRSWEVAVTEFRAGVIIGAGSVSFDLVRYLTERVPVLISPRWVSTLTQPIAIDDVLRYLVECLEMPETEKRILEIGGRDVLSYGQMMLTYAKVRGLRRWLVPVPVLTPRLSSWWVRLVTPLPVSVARPLIDGVKNQVIVEDSAARQLFGFTPLGYEAAVRTALKRAEAGNVETIWSGALSSFPTRNTPQQFLHEKTDGMISYRREISTKAPAAGVFRVLTSLGGKTGWLYADILWKLRGYLDELVGGVGLSRGRRVSEELRVGDPLDFWRVEALVPDQLLRLRAEMKVPGKAWLQFEIIPQGETEVRIIQTAFYEPKGLRGLLYWYALYPIHRVIFQGMITAIAHKAESLSLTREKAPA
jgi:uncharacterized protein YbjT (DUF2867 family)